MLTSAEGILSPLRKSYIRRAPAQLRRQDSSTFRINPDIGLHRVVPFAFITASVRGEQTEVELFYFLRPGIKGADSWLTIQGGECFPMLTSTRGTLKRY